MSLSRLWSSSGYERLSAAQQVSPDEAKELVDNLVASAPGGRWPYAMPTSVNPYIVVLGVSPGASPSASDAHIDTESATYPAPTIGMVHRGFFYSDTKHYWVKVRQLCVEFVTRLSPSVPEEEALALAGHLNLATGRVGSASEAALDPPFVRWVGETIVRRLRPRVVVGLGVYGILSKQPIIEDAVRSGGLDLDLRHPDELCSLPGQRYSYRVWHRSTADGSPLSFISWPNHPSRHPFAGEIGNSWTESVRIGTGLLD